MSEKCRICGGALEVFGRAEILHKYDIGYHRCTECGAVMTEQPYWLEEAYGDAIVDADIGLLMRNNYLAPRVAAILNLCFADKCSINIDYAGGVWRINAPYERRRLCV